MEQFTSKYIDTNRNKIERNGLGVVTVSYRHAA